MEQKRRLAELQLAIMQVLWDSGEATVADVRDALRPGRELAYNTVGTMLTKMEANGQVQHRSEGRVNLYSAAWKRDQVSQSMVSDLAERLFRGNVSELMCHLFDGCDVTRDDITQLKRLIRQKEKELRDDA
ncbi:MAG: BlaI/MecI/CopY family transcriptional regulator [Planctomycetota bacterium]|nr:BlaI/MecI/CopY family transcriptional regulator [Planctomycetota bacterium]